MGSIVGDDKDAGVRGVVRGESVVNDFAFVSMPVNGWMHGDARPWRRQDPAAIGTAFVAQVALALA
jgi:hypothetical protein